MKVIIAALLALAACAPDQDKWEGLPPGATCGRFHDGEVTQCVYSDSVYVCVYANDVVKCARAGTVRTVMPESP